jgi:DNA-binding SARP family transcriptional activator
METQWRIELLGGLRATRGDQDISRFRSQKTGALVAYLAYHLSLAVLVRAAELRRQAPAGGCLL